jgi:anti-sigma-K factor RskA
MNTNQPGGMPPDIHQLAGEYVLGTLPAARRREVQARLKHDPQLQAAVLAWEERLLPLTGLVEPVAPSPRLWARIERSLDARATPAPQPVRRPAPRRLGWRWDSLALWRGLTAGGFALATVLAAVLVGRLAEPAPETRFMVVLVAPDDKAPGWVVQAGASGARQVELIPLGAVEVPPDKALQFWTKADGWGAPVSLGLVTPGKTLRVPAGSLPAVQPDQLFELTLEPRSGSPTGRPTGPVRYIGRAVKVM